MLLATTSLCLSLSLVSLPAKAATLRVPDDYPTVADAALAALAGDVVEIGEGTFAGTVTVTVDLSLVGAGAGLTVLQGGTHTALRATNAVLSVSDLTVASSLTAGPAVDLSSSVATFSGVTFQGTDSYSDQPAILGVQSDLSLQGGSFSQTGRAIDLTEGTLTGNDAAIDFSIYGGVRVTDGALSLVGGSLTGPAASFPPYLELINSPGTLDVVTVQSVRLYNDGESLTVSDSTFTGEGTGLSIGGPFSMQGSTFEEVTGDNGVIISVSGAPATFEDNVFEGCESVALLVGYTSFTLGEVNQIEARRNRISGSSFEGFVQLNEGSLIFEDNILEDNEGSLLIASNYDELRIAGNAFSRNVASGALLSVQYANQAPAVEIFDNVFRDNQGSSMVQWYGADVEIVHNLFLGNDLEEVSYAVGVLISNGYSPNDQASIVQNTFAGTEGAGPVVGTQYGQVQLINNLVVGHQGPAPAVVGPVSMSYNLFWDNAGGDRSGGAALPATNLAADPGFDTWRQGPSTALDLVLLPGSAALDAGDPTLQDADGSPSDLGYTGGPTLDPLLAVDLDLDGSSARFDCIDSDGAVFPGQVELCGDDIDSDCDGDPDQGIAYTDADGDGFGDLTLPQVVDVCTLDGTALSATDCDDNDAGVSPSGSETCDGRDEDCNGQIDDIDCGQTPPSTTDPIETPDAEAEPDEEKPNGGCGCATERLTGHWGLLLGMLLVLRWGRR